MPGEQNFKVSLSFRDEATGKFIKATEEQIAAIKKLGITVKKEGAGVGVDMDKMAKKTHEAGGAYRFLGGQITGVMRSLGSLRNMILVYLFALRPLFNLVKESTKAYIEQEDALARLNFALGLQGTAAKIVSNELVSLSKKFQETTRYSDEMALQIMDKFATLTTVMPKDFEKVTQAVFNYAATLRKDPVEAADLFIRGAQGTTTGIRRAGIVIDEATPKARVLGEMLRFVNEHMGGRAQKDIETYGGKLVQLSNSISELNEGIGLLIIRGLNLPTVVDFWKDFFINLNKAITGEGVTVLNTLEKQLADVNKRITEAGAEAKAIEAPGFWAFVFKGIREMHDAEVEEAKKLLNEREIILRTIKFEQQVQTNNKILAEQQIAAEREKQLKIQAQDDFLVAYNSLASRRIEVERETLEINYARFKKHAEDKLAVERLYKEEKDRIDKEAEALEKARMGVTYDAMTTLLQAYAVNMRNAMAEGFFKVIKGDFESLSDVVRTFGDAMLKTITEIIAQLMIMTIWKRAAGLLGFPGGFILGHTGGYMYAENLVYGQPRRRFHSGGEVPATLLEGEGVLNRRAMANLGVNNLDKLNRGEAAGGTVINNYYIQTIDERSFRERLQEHGDIYSGASKRGIEDNTALRKTSQRFG